MVRPCSINELICISTLSSKRVWPRHRAGTHCYSRKAATKIRPAKLANSSGPTHQSWVHGGTLMYLPTPISSLPLLTVRGGIEHLLIGDFVRRPQQFQDSERVRFSEHCSRPRGTERRQIKISLSRWLYSYHPQPSQPVCLTRFLE